MAGGLKDPLDGNPSGPTAVYKVRLQEPVIDTEAVAAAQTDSAGSLGASVMLLLAVFALDAWRALRQSITHDEALAYIRRVAADAAGAAGLGGGDAHVVHAMLARLAVGLAGPQEWALRLPSLMGALLFLVGGLCLCRLAFGRGWLAFLGFALLALHPLLLDLQSLGRGDGLALGLLLWGALHLLHFLKGTSSNVAVASGPVHAVAGSLVLGLSAASCPRAAPAALALLAMAVVATLAQRRHLPGGASTGGRVGVALAGLLCTGPLIAATLLVLPLSQGDWRAEFTGTSDLAAASADWTAVALAHEQQAWPLAPGGPFDAPARAVVMLLFGPVLLVAVAVRLGAVLLRWRRATSVAELSPFERAQVLLGGGFIGAAVLVALGRVALDLPWPDARTGAPLLVLALLCATALAAEGWRRGGVRRLLALPALGLLFALLLQFGSQVQVSHYGLWPRDAGARDAFEQLVLRQDRSPRVSVRVAAPESLQPALDFYRLQRRAGWMQPVQAGLDAGPAGADFVLLPLERAGEPAFAALSVPWRDEAARVALLESPRP